jgi:hypothetical protein
VPAAAVRRDPDPPLPRRREMATWLELTIVTIALLVVMFLALWGSRFEARVSLLVDRIH